MLAAIVLTGPAAVQASAAAGSLVVDAPSGAVGPGTVVFRGRYQGAVGIEQHVSYAVDVSGSTTIGSDDCDGNGSVDVGDDFNADGTFGTTLDCEIAGVAALNSSLRDHTTALQASLIAFADFSDIADMNPGDPDEPETASTADQDNDRIPDVQQVAASLDAVGGLNLFTARPSVGGGTNFAAPITQFQALVANASPPSGTKGQYTLFFVSDGLAVYPAAEVDALRQVVAARDDLLPVIVNTVSVGAGGAGCGIDSPLRQISDALGGSCSDVQPAQLQAALGDVKPIGLDHIEVAFAGGTQTATVDALGGWTATFPNVQASITDYPYTATAFRTDGTTDVKTGSVTVRAGRIRYVALGDSYSAGWGLLPYLAKGAAGEHADFDVVAADDPGECGRSPLASAFSVKLPNALLPIYQDARAEMRFRACGGAVSLDLVGRQQHKPSEAGPQLSFIDDSTDLVTLTMGGNDVNFANIMAKCAMNHSSDCQDQAYLKLNSGRVLTLDEFTNLRLALVQVDLLDAFRKVRARAPNATVLVADYPHLLSVNAPGRCTEEAAFSRGEREWLKTGVDRMGTLIGLVARQAGVFSSSVIKDFAAHEKCGGGAEWMYGIETSTKQTDVHDACTTKTVTVFGKRVSQTGCLHARSFHPRPEGAAAYGAAYTAAIKKAAGAPPNGTTRSGLPRNPEPELAAAPTRTARSASRSAVPLRAAAAALTLDRLSARDQDDVRGFTADAATVTDLPNVQGQAPPAACDTPLRVLPGQVIVLSGGDFKPGTRARPTLVFAGATNTLDPVRVDSEGNATVAVIMPLVIGSDPAVVFTIDGTGSSGYPRSTASALVNGRTDTDCITAQRKAGLLSADGRRLPRAAKSFWVRSRLVALKTPRRLTRTVTSATTPRRDRTRPYTFTTRGRIVAPPRCRSSASEAFTAGTCLPHTVKCTGRVIITFKTRGRHGRTIARRAARLRSNCTYTSRVTVRVRGTLRVLTRFAGNPSLAPKAATTYTVRTGS